MHTIRKESTQQQQQQQILINQSELIGQRVSSPGQRVIIRGDSPQPKRIIQSPGQQFIVREVREGQTNPHTVYVTRQAVQEQAIATVPVQRKTVQTV